MPHTSKIIMLICCLFALGACSTVEGIGKDLKKGGQVIQKAAKDASK